MIVGDRSITKLAELRASSQPWTIKSHPLLMEEGNYSSETSNKVVLIGNQDVGKTTIFSRFKTGRFVNHIEQTKLAAEHCKELTTESGRRVEVCYCVFVLLIFLSDFYKVLSSCKLSLEIPLGNF